MYLDGHSIKHLTIRLLLNQNPEKIPLELAI